MENKEGAQLNFLQVLIHFVTSQSPVYFLLFTIFEQRYAMDVRINIRPGWSTKQSKPKYYKNPRIYSANTNEFE
jgi:hypothetical protein